MIDPLESDARLWDACRRGDREAFGALVTRYQGLICSLAYSRTGNVALSEEVAQETFLAAWLQMRKLREPDKLRSWLCGIVRNQASQAGRRRRRGRAIPLEEAAEPRSRGADPEALAVSRQQEQMVWQVLERIPTQYREPLVLFYRENQSIEAVAEMLDLSTDAVKQRLSRGRALLRQEFAERLETTLSGTRPGHTFTTAVLGVIATMPKAAVAGPMIGLGLAWTAARLAGKMAHSERERFAIARQFRDGIVFTLAMIALLLAMVFGVVRGGMSPWLLGLGSLVWVGVLLWRLTGLGTNLRSQVVGIRGVADDSPQARRIESRHRLLGLPLFCYSSGGLDLAARHGIAWGWVAVGDLAVSPLLAIGGTAIAPVAIGGLSVGVISIGALSLGVWALGFQAIGWAAAGAMALAWRGAMGGVALAHDFALGGMARAAHANNEVASAWFGGQWWPGPALFLAGQAWWVVGLCIVVPLIMMARRVWRKK